MWDNVQQLGTPDRRRQGSGRNICNYGACIPAVGRKMLPSRRLLSYSDAFSHRHVLAAIYNMIMSLSSHDEHALRHNVLCLV